MSGEEKEIVQAPGEEVEVETEAPEASVGSGSAASAPTGAGVTSNERTWAVLAHASILLTFALGLSSGGLAVIVAALIPLAIWLAFRDRSPFVAFHALQATLFQLGALAVWIGLLIVGLAVLIPAWIVTALLLIILIGFLLLPLTLVLTVTLPVLLLLLPFACLVYGLYGAYEVYAGRPFRYWLVADWIESRGMEMTP